SINLAQTDLTARRKCRLVMEIFLKAVPLIVTLFLLFPRLSAPLFAFAGSESSASTGLSDSMTPGSINRLIESNAVALRAQFTGAVPGPSRLYWRGPVFGQFDGRTWTRKNRRLHDARLDMTLVRFDAASAVEYTVTMEPTNRNWVL